MAPIQTKRRALLFFLLIAVGTSQAEPRVDVRDDPHGTGCGKDHSFKEDNVKLFVKTDDGQTAQVPFCAAYGRAAVFLERDSKQQYFALLRYGSGRGDSDGREFLKIFKIGPKPEELKTVQLGASSGPESRWFYEIDISKPETGGLRLALALKQQGPGTTGVPKEKKKIVDVP